jgi:hypothetical protein
MSLSSEGAWPLGVGHISLRSLTGALLTALVFSACGSVTTSQTSPAVSAASSAPMASPSPTVASPSPSVTSPTPTIPSDWGVITDSKYGFTLRYPSSWTDKSVARGDPPGSHELTSRAGAQSPAGLAATDWWLTAEAYPPDNSIGCGEPVFPDQKDGVQLDGHPATRFVRNGWQGDRNGQVIDVIAIVSGNCYHLQQITGGGVPADEAMATFQVIQFSYRFSA